MRRALAVSGLGVALLAVIGWSMAQPPVVKTYAYGRATTPGIPEDTSKGGATGASRPSPFPLTYLVYVEVPRGSAVSIDGVWLHGHYYAATLRKVPSPVVVNRDPVVVTDQKDTLVGKTANDVYAVVLGPQKPRETSGPAEKQLLADHEAVVFLTVDHTPRHGTVTSVKMLKPRAAP